MEFRIGNKLDEKTETLITQVIGAIIEVHKILGPGYFEKTYENALVLEFRQRGLSYRTQQPVGVFYKGVKIHGQVLDMVVEDKLILELKAVEKILPVHEAQILSYLKSTCYQAGLLINFSEMFVKDGIKRFVRTHNR